MQLYNTKVVPSSVDEQWVTPALPDMSGAKVLVITLPFANGSTEEQTLQKMMAACKLSTDDYTILQIGTDEQLSWQAIAGGHTPKTILLLGVVPAQLSIHALFRLNTPNPFMGCSFIPSLSLTDIENNPSAKKDLWSTGLKPAFGL